MQLNSSLRDVIGSAVCDFQEVTLNQRWLVSLSPFSSSILITWNVNTMADALAAILDNEFEDHNLDTMAGW